MRCSANADQTDIVLDYEPQGQPGRHCLLLGTAGTKTPDFYVNQPVNSEQMKKLLSCRAGGGYFDRATEYTNLKLDPCAKNGGYMLSVFSRQSGVAPRRMFFEDLSSEPGAALAAVKRLRSALNGGAADAAAAAAVGKIFREMGEAPAATGEAAWGQPAAGLQVRLLPSKALWKAGDVPTFSIDLRNVGKVKQPLPPLLGLFNLRIDGKLYHRRDDFPKTMAMDTLTLEAGANAETTHIEIGDHYALSDDPSKRPDLSSGKHTAEIVINLATGESKPVPVEVSSNIVEFEILPQHRSSRYDAKLTERSDSFASGTRGHSPCPTPHYGIISAPKKGPPPKIDFSSSFPALARRTGLRPSMP